MHQPSLLLPSQKALIRQNRRKRAAWSNQVILLGLSLLALVFIAPFAWLVITSLKATNELATYPIQWLPAHAHWDNFVKAFTMIDYLHFAWNSVLLSTLFSVLVTFSSAAVGFGFARLRGWGKRQLFFLMLSTIMLPPILSTIPTYVIYSRLGLINTYWPWVFSGVGSSAFLNFLYRQFFASIPPELEEAAIVDGCSYGRMFLQIFLPLSKPIVATSFIISFAGVWGDYLTPLLFLNGDNTTLAVGIARGYVDPHIFVVYPNIVAAGTIFYVLPLLVLFFFAQRAFVRGIVTTGLKG